MSKVGELNITQQETLHVVYGDDLNRLAESLGDELFASSTHPFENRLVVVPNISMKDFLFSSFTENPRLQMAAGVQVLPLNQAVMEILDRFSSLQDKKKIPSFLELSLAIEEQLHRFYSHFPALAEYLSSGDAEKRRQRISALSDELAKLFARYGLYGMAFLPQWLSKDNPGWQQALWAEIFSDHSPWTYPIQVLKKIQIKNFQGKIALFGFSFLSPVHLSFFSSLSASVYQLSPCSLFWEDLASDKERLLMGRVLKRKGVKENVREEIDHYMQESHPLLGNWGRLEREMLKSLDSFVLTEDEVYEEPEGTSLLSSLKRSFLTLDETFTPQADDSIQLHSATSKLREIEVLRDALETMLHNHNQRGDPISLQQIVVASPDISSYAPYIQMVFSQSSFPFAIEGMPLSSVSESVQGFLQLIRLPRERYALPSIVKLLRCSSFLEKRGFALDEINQLSKWFKQAEIRRDLSATPNSWEEGIDRLLFGLASIPGKDGDFDTWPVSCIPQSEMDLFSRFLELFSEIKNDHSLLCGEKTASEWLELFVRMADKYFQIEWEREPLFQELKSLIASTRVFSDRIWTFESMERVLKHLSQKPAGEISSSQMQKITFTTLSSGNLGAARIIWCLGMDEGAFPRADSRSSLCEMKGGDYYPARTDEDRAQFLELFVKAQDYLIFSYQRVHVEDAKHQGPSLLIEELNQYLSKQGIQEGIAKIDHPSFPFDRVYFSSDAKVKKWASTDYLAAHAHYFPQIKNQTFFALKPFHADSEQEIVIDIRQLKKLARHPLQFYFNETLKIFLKEEDDEEEAEFLISRLRKSILRKKALNISLPTVMKRIKAEGKLPRGLFQDVATQDLQEEMADLLSTLNAFEIRPEEIRSIRLSSSCHQLEESETLLPPLSIPLSNSRIAHVTGLLEDVSPKGLLFNGEKDLKDLVKAWPLYLIHCCLFPEIRSLLLTKEGSAIDIPVSDPKGALASYIEYFLLAKQNPSPMMPDFVKALLEGEENDLKVVMGKDLMYEDAYLNYLKRRGEILDPVQSFALWNAQLKTTFAPLLQL